MKSFRKITSRTTDILRLTCIVVYILCVQSICIYVTLGAKPPEAKFAAPTFSRVPIYRGPICLEPFFSSDPLSVDILSFNRKVFKLIKVEAFSNSPLASESYILSELEINSTKLCLLRPGWSTDMNSLLTKNANFCFDFYWCNLCVYRLAFISLWCSQHGGFSSIYIPLISSTAMILSDLIQL